VFVFDRTKRVPKPRKQTNVVLPKEFDLGDPFSHGKQLGGSTTAHTRRHSNPPFKNALVDIDEDYLAYAEFPEDVVDDMFALVAESHCVPDAGGGEATSEADDVCDAIADESELIAAARAAEEEEQEGDIEEGEETRLDEVVREEAIAAQPSVADFVAAAVMDANGYITCPIAPFNNMMCVGRLTTWPKGHITNQTNVGMHCYMHGTKCKVARKRLRFTDERLMSWLFHGEPVTAANRCQAEELKTKHEILGVAKL
jgi:hypothetical protein